jgi:hypothetical protein
MVLADPDEIYIRIAEVPAGGVADITMPDGDPEPMTVTEAACDATSLISMVSADGIEPRGSCCHVQRVGASHTLPGQ